MRTLVIGDIHGTVRALEQVLERSNFDNSKDRLIFLGDYVDGYSESAQVIQKLIQIKNESHSQHVFIRGNHDDWCYEWLKFGVPNIGWLSNGGQTTLKSYTQLQDKINRIEHLKFFEYLDNYYIDEQNRGFVHAGFVSKNGLGHDVTQSNYYWDRDMWSLALIQHNNFHDGDLENTRRFEKHREIYIGHTTTMLNKCKPHLPEYKNKLQEHKGGRISVPMNRCNVWNMDTGAGYKGKLSIMDIDTKEIWQSDYVNELYPNETGR